VGRFRRREVLIIERRGLRWFRGENPPKKGGQSHPFWVLKKMGFSSRANSTIGQKTEKRALDTQIEELKPWEVVERRKERVPMTQGMS